MPLNFNPASFNPVVAGLDDLGTAVTNAMSRRAERGYTLDAEKRRRQNQLQDMSTQRTHQVEDQDRANYERDYSPIVNSLSQPEMIDVRGDGSLLVPSGGMGRRMAGVLGMGGYGMGGGMNGGLGQERLDQSKAMADDRNANSIYQSRLNSIPRQQHVQVADPYGGPAKTVTQDDPQYQAKVDSAMQDTLFEAHNAGNRALAKRILMAHPNLGEGTLPGEADPLSGIKAWAYSSDQESPPMGQANGASSQSVNGMPPQARNGMSQGRRAQLEMMLADPRLQKYNPERIPVLQKLLANEDQIAAPQPGASAPTPSDDRAQNAQFYSNDVEPPASSPAVAALSGPPPAAPPAAVSRMQELRQDPALANPPAPGRQLPAYDPAAGNAEMGDFLKSTHFASMPSAAGPSQARPQVQRLVGAIAPNAGQAAAARAATTKLISDPTVDPEIRKTAQSVHDQLLHAQMLAQGDFASGQRSADPADIAAMLQRALAQYQQLQQVLSPLPTRAQ